MLLSAMKKACNFNVVRMWNSSSGTDFCREIGQHSVSLI